MSRTAADVHAARAYLLRVAEPPAPGLAALVASVGPIEAAERVRRRAVGGAAHDETQARHGVERAIEDLRAAELLGARLLIPEDDEWPAWPFAAYATAADDDLVEPLALWVRGSASLAELAESAVAVVGARAATGYGSYLARQLGFELADRGFTVVSGAALGIDGAAHRGALDAEQPTVAVLACGVDRSYPAGHDGLLSRIAETGLVVSEYPPGAVPARHRFLIRNRIIAGLAAGTVVVEAGLRSGARRTASDAMGLGRPVMAVPGPVISAQSAGCHALVRDCGALLVTRAAEVAEAVGRIGVDLAEPLSRTDARETDELDRTSMLVHGALPLRATRTTFRLSVDAGVPVERVRAALPELERRGLVEQSDGAWRRRRASA